ncbi:MAG TPA: hypothetical protein DEF30_11305 [Proteiniclasticum sp.]|nr:hypothetical protein [Proteiniclasticum sp.]
MFFDISSNEVHARCNKEKTKVTFLLKQLLHLIILRKKDLQIVRSWDDDADSFYYKLICNLHDKENSKVLPRFDVRVSSYTNQGTSFFIVMASRVHYNETSSTLNI